MPWTTCGWSCRGGIENAEMRRCGGLYIPFAPLGDPAPSPLPMEFRRIAFARTDHFCNSDGIAKTLFCCHRKGPPKHGKSLSAVSGCKRYNTLDFAGQNRVPTGCCSPLLDDPEPRGCSPLDTCNFLHTVLHKLKNALRKQCEEKQKGSPYRRAMQSSF